MLLSQCYKTLPNIPVGIQAKQKDRARHIVVLWSCFSFLKGVENKTPGYEFRGKGYTAS